MRTFLSLAASYPTHPGYGRVIIAVAVAVIAALVGGARWLINRIGPRD